MNDGKKRRRRHREPTAEGQQEEHAVADGAQLSSAAPVSSSVQHAKAARTARAARAARAAGANCDEHEAPAALATRVSFTAQAGAGEPSTAPDAATPSGTSAALVPTSFSSAETFTEHRRKRSRRVGAAQHGAQADASVSSMEAAIGGGLATEPVGEAAAESEPVAGGAGSRAPGMPAELGPCAGADEGPSVRMQEIQYVVKLYVTSAKPHYSMPWQTRRQQMSTASGFIMSGRRILTNAHAVAYQSSVRVRRHGSALKVGASFARAALAPLRTPLLTTPLAGAGACAGGGP